MLPHSPLSPCLSTLGFKAQFCSLLSSLPVYPARQEWSYTLVPSPAPILQWSFSQGASCISSISAGGHEGVQGAVAVGRALLLPRANCP